MKTKFKSKLLSILLVLVMVLALVPVSALTVFAAGENVDFSIKESWGVYFEQTGLNRKYPIVLTNENKLSTPLPTLYRTDSDDYVFDGWYIADTDTKVTQDTVFDGYTVVVDRWTFQEKDANTVISNIRINNVELEAGMTTAEYNAEVQGATATVNGAPADAITADSATTYTIYHGLNKSGDPLGVDEEVEVGKDYSVVTKIKLADGYTFSPNITFISDGGLCASERFLGGADLYTREWNTLATEIEMTINFMNTDYYFDQTPESRNLENYTQYKNWYTVSKFEGLESVTLQYESGGEWAVFIDNVPFEADGEQAGGYVTVSPYMDTTKTFRLVANYTQGTVYSEPFEISWACLNPVIKNVGIGVTAPMNGFAPQYTATTDSNRYTFKSENSENVKNGIRWMGDVAGELTVVGSKFDNENDYTVSIKLVAQDGYTFANDVTATINANNANVSVESDTEIRISYTFPKPEKTKWYVTFSNPGGYASGDMQPVQVEEGEYTLPEPTYTPNTGFAFEGWVVNGLLKQPGDKITVTSNTYLEARWISTVDYNAPHGFTKQPADASNIVGMQIQYAVDNFTIDPSITYEHVFAEIYNAETGEWVTEYNGAHAGNGIIEAYGQQYINFSSDAVGEFTFRLYAIQGSTKVAISENFTVTWAAKQFTTQPQGDMVVVGETVTVTADKNFYVEKYEIEYNEGGVWKLYQEITVQPGEGWDAFSFDFTSNAAKSVTFRITAYAEGDVYDEENDCFPIELIDTSDEFTITWTSNEHVHTYGATPNGKDETNHWKECTDPACPDKNNSKIETTAHKDNNSDRKCDICGYDLPAPEYMVSYSGNGDLGGSMIGGLVVEGEEFTLDACEFVAPEGKRFAGWAVGNVNATPLKQANDKITINAETVIYAIWEDIPVVKYTVSFDANGGTGTMSDDPDQLGGYALPDCDFTAPEGHEFKCWSVNGEEKDVGIEIDITANTTVKAIWQAKSYTITFDTTGGSAINSITQEYGTAIDAPANPTKDGYTFTGWSPAIPATMPANNITVTAQWEEIVPNTYIVTYTDGVNDVTVFADQIYANVTEGTATPAFVGTPSREGYTFKGWTPTVANTVTATVTYTATWEINQYTITFNTDGGSIVAPITQNYGTTVTAPTAPTKTGYTFTGWSAEVPTTMPAENITLTAQWTVNQYTITFDTAGGNSIAPITQNYGTAIEAPANPTKDGYTFTGWDKTIPSTMPAENITITATWSQNHQHSDADGKWESDGTYHWHTCSCSHEFDKAECSGGTATCTAKAVCSVCNNEYGTTTTHNHGSEWKKDADNHWNECACGDKANKAAHTDSNNDGKCDTCEYQMSTTPDNPDNPNNTPDNPNNTPDDPSDDKDGLGAGAIVGIVIGSVAVVGIGGFALFWFVIKKKSFADLVAVFKKK